MRSPYSRALYYSGEAPDDPARIARLRRQLAITERYLSGWDARDANLNAPQPVGQRAFLETYRTMLLVELAPFVRPADRQEHAACRTG